MKHILACWVVILFSITFYPSDTYSFWGSAQKMALKLGKLADSLPSSKIDDLTELINKKGAGGLDDVGKLLGKLRLSDEALEDTYMRISLKQGKFNKREANEIFSNLSGITGFRKTIRVAASSHSITSKGALHEIRLANYAVVNKFEVIGIRHPFSDGLKKAPTDIDLILKKNNSVFALELKDYSSTTQIPLDKFRADMDSLVKFKLAQPEQTHLIFSVTNKPQNVVTQKLLNSEAKKRGIELIYGSSDEQIHLINQLAEIL